jgi:methionyl-tRNA formyltransferase
MKSDNRKYVFVGNRYWVLEQMLNLQLDIICIFAVKNSYLEKELESRSIDYTSVCEKSELINQLSRLRYDILISNGCPYILPISELKKTSQIFINVHPSLLPDLKGKNPINGAILFGHEHGVTCHFMNDGIDTGDIISQIKIDNAQNIPLPLLYQLSFIAEGKVFRKAYERDFKAEQVNVDQNGDIYYSRQERDRVILFNEDVSEIERKVKAFALPGLYAYFVIQNEKFHVRNITEISSNEISTWYEKNNDGDILVSDEWNLIIKYKGKLLILNIVESTYAIAKNNIIYVDTSV